MEYSLSRSRVAVRLGDKVMFWMKLETIHGYCESLGFACFINIGDSLSGSPSSPSSWCSPLSADCLLPCCFAWVRWHSWSSTIDKYWAKLSSTVDKSSGRALTSVVWIWLRVVPFEILEDQKSSTILLQTAWVATAAGKLLSVLLTPCTGDMDQCSPGPCSGIPLCCCWCVLSFWWLLELFAVAEIGASIDEAEISLPDIRRVRIYKVNLMQPEVEMWMQMSWLPGRLRWEGGLLNSTPIPDIPERSQVWLTHTGSLVSKTRSISGRGDVASPGTRAPD